MRRRSSRTTFRLILAVIFLSAPDAIGLEPASLGPQAGAGPGAAAVRVVLSEVLSEPRTGELPFVEIFNAGSNPADLSMMSLQIGEKAQLLARVAQPLAPGDRLLVRFDGEGRFEGRVLHATAGVTLPADGGTIELRDANDRVLDRVAWGTAPGAIAPGAGGLTRLDDVRSRPGRSIGRAPGATRPDVVSEWTAYAPEAVTPGAANPLPAIAELMPIDGAILDGTSARLTWYPEPGSHRYQVQVATAADFTSPIADVTAGEAEVQTGTLAPGRYFWRVQAIAEDGTRAPYSAASGFGLGAAGDDPAPAARALPFAASIRRAGAGGPPIQERSLNVPYLTQHKDSPLLQLENPRYRDAHGWDVDHKVFRNADKSDSHNCAVANVAMVNRYFGGDLTQDRIGYEVLSDAVARHAARLSQGPLASVLADPRFRAMLNEVRPGPEMDFPYGRGLNTLQVTAALLFALGVEPVLTPDYQSKEALWTDVVSEIDAGRPVVAAGRRHTYTIRAYSRRGARRTISLNDPANGRYTVDFDAWAAVPANISTWRIPPGATGTLIEAEASLDGDGDGVMDFDETRRFKTDPGSRDSDRDLVPDKEDIASGVFEVEFSLGYAMFAQTVDSGRDYDDDRLPTERDPDSDNGGCLDGEEDLDRDGFRAGSERSNFNTSDDLCGSLSGSITFTHAFVHDPLGNGQVVTTTNETMTVILRLKNDPSRGPEHYVDDGSRFVVRGVHRLEVQNGSCPITGRETAAASGTFADPSSIGGHLSSDGLVVAALVDVPARGANDDCLMSEQGPTHMSFSLPDCLGKPVGRRADRTYTFNCSPPPPAPGMTFTRWSISGTVRLR